MLFITDVVSTTNAPREQVYVLTMNYEVEGYFLVKGALNETERRVCHVFRT